MSALAGGVRLSVLLGDHVPLPAGADVVQALESVTVTSSATGTGFQATFRLGRELSPDFSLVSGNTLGPFTRVVLTVALGVLPTVISDGVVTHQQLAPSGEPGASRLTVSGRDLSVLMDLEERSAGAANQSDSTQVQLALARYATYGITPVVTTTTNVPLETDRVPRQAETDLVLIRRLARENGFVFRLDPTGPGLVDAYWGPDLPVGVPQPALSVGQGAHANLASLNVTVDPLAPVGASMTVVDPLLKLPIPVPPAPSLRLPPLARDALPVRRTTIQRDAAGRSLGDALTASAATATNAPPGVVATGTVDLARYGAIIRSGAPIGVRGAGQSMDGNWWVDSVTHTIRPGTYTQSFRLSRDGTGALTPAVLP